MTENLRLASRVLQLTDIHYPKCEIDALALQSRLEFEGFVVLVEKTNGFWIVYVHEIRRVA